MTLNNKSSFTPKPNANHIESRCVDVVVEIFFILCSFSSGVAKMYHLCTKNQPMPSYNNRNKTARVKRDTTCFQNQISRPNLAISFNGLLSIILNVDSYKNLQTILIATTNVSFIIKRSLIFINNYEAIDELVMC